MDLAALGVDADDARRVPHLRVRRIAISSARGSPTASTTTSTPRPSVAALTARARVLLGEVDRLRAEAARHPEPARDGVDRDHVRGAGKPARPARRTGRPGRGRAPRRCRRASRRRRRPRGSRSPSRRRRTARRRRRARRAPCAASGSRAGRAPARPACPAASRASRRGRRSATSSHLWKCAARQKQHDPARGLEAAEHAVADGDLRDRVAGGDHLADVLVPDREAGLDLHAPVEDVQVRPADAGRLDPHDRVVGREQLGLGAVVDPDLAAASACGGAPDRGGQGSRVKPMLVAWANPRTQITVWCVRGRGRASTYRRCPAGRTSTSLTATRSGPPTAYRIASAMSSASSNSPISSRIFSIASTTIGCLL